MNYEVKVDEREVARLVAALEKAADGDEMMAEFARDLAAIAREIAVKMRAEVSKPFGSIGLGRIALPPLRAAIARGVNVNVRLAGKPRVGIVAEGRGMPRDFETAPMHTNRKSWRHRVFGRDDWETQVGRPGWFDDTAKRNEDKAVRAAQKVLQHYADRIERDAKG